VLTGCFVPSLLPIALAYQLAHNLSFLLLGVQYMVPLVSDPFGFGWNIFDTTLYIVDPSLVSAKMLWTVAVVAIVAGHAAAVYLSHVVALRVFDRNLATRSQLPMLVLMVAYTMTSLWILAQPITNARTGG
jgi:H+/Cl- antiporter ClcA